LQHQSKFSTRTQIITNFKIQFPEIKKTNYTL
jgi:hypothetical protein